MGLAYSKQNENEIAMDHIKRLSCREDLSLLYNVCLYFIHKNDDNTNSQVTEQFYRRIKELITASNYFCLHSSALISFSFGDLKLAETFLDEIKDNQQTYSLRGWICLMRMDYKNAFNHFDNILSNHKTSIDLLSMYGKAVLLSGLGDYSNSIQIYAKIMSHYNFPEMYFEEARIYIAMNRWRLAAETVKANQSSYFSKFEMNLIDLFNCLISNSDIVLGEQIIKQLITDVEQHESKNWKLCLEIGKALISICHQTNEIIEHIIEIIKIASKSSKNVLPFLSYCYFMKQDYLFASETVSSIQNDDIYSIESQIGILFESNRMSEVVDKLDLYNDLSDEFLQLKTLEVKLFRINNGCTGDNVYDLSKMLFNHFEIIQAKYEKSFLKENVSLSDDSTKNNKKDKKEEIKINSSSSNIKRLNKHQCILSQKNIDKIFESNFAPMESLFEKYLSFLSDMRFDSIVSALDEMIMQNKNIIYSPAGELEEKITNFFTQLFKIIPNTAPMKLQYALFLQKKRKYQESLQVIETYLIHRWPFRLPLCLFAASQNELILNNIERSRNYLDSALYIAPSFSKLLDFMLLKCKLEKDLRYLPDGSSFSNLPMFYMLNIIDLSIEFGDIEKSEHYYQIAINNIKTPREKAHLVLRQSLIFVLKKQYFKAFKALETLSKHKRFTREALITKAKIYLNSLHDYDNFMMQYEHLCEQNPTKENYLIAGDAFSEILEYENAVYFYQEAYKIEENPAILEKIVHSLIKDHQYNNAISKYKMIGSSPLFLIQMLYKLKQFEKAKQFVEHSVQIMQMTDQIRLAPFIELRGDIHSQLKEDEEAIEDYRSALSIYTRIFENSFSNIFIDDLRKKASVIACKIGDHTIAKEKILDEYYLSLKYDPGNIDAFVALFNFYKMRNDLNVCHKLCLDFLEKSSRSETVALLLTTIETRDFTRSIMALENVLDAHPRYHRALVRLIEICARAGKLEIAKARMKNYENNFSPGVAFCHGLLMLYLGNNQEALKHFTFASKNRKWGLNAKICIFNLYVNPERKYIWCETEPLSSEENLNKASEILSSLNHGEVENLLMTAELFSAHNNEQAVQRALGLYHQILDIQQQNIPALVGIARCHIRLGDKVTANSYIDKVLLFKPFHETFMYFEECYLMRASLILNDKDFRGSQHFIFLAIDLNLSSKKGWEMSGIVHKQNRMYAEAAIAYSKCWDLGDRKDEDLGFNYAYCSLKANRPDEALVIARKLLDQNPTRRDIVEQIMIPAFKILKF